MLPQRQPQSRRQVGLHRPPDPQLLHHVHLRPLPPALLPVSSQSEDPLPGDQQIRRADPEQAPLRPGEDGVCRHVVLHHDLQRRAHHRRVRLESRHRAEDCGERPVRDLCNPSRGRQPPGLGRGSPVPRVLQQVQHPHSHHEEGHPERPTLHPLLRPLILRVRVLWLGRPRPVPHQVQESQQHFRMPLRHDEWRRPFRDLRHHQYQQQPHLVVQSHLPLHLHQHVHLRRHISVHLGDNGLLRDGEGLLSARRDLNQDPGDDCRLSR